MTSPPNIGTLPLIESSQIASQLERLEMQAQRRLGNRVRGFRAVLRPEGLVLQGRAVTYHAKQIAQHAVMDLTDLPILANDIEVC